MIYSTSRLIYAIGRDGLLPRWFGHDCGHLPENALWTVVTVIALMGGLVPSKLLVHLVNIGTLIAFAFVYIGNFPLRRHEAIKQLGLLVPGVPVTHIVTFLFCLLLMTTSSAETWLMSLAWFAFGLDLVY